MLLVLCLLLLLIGGTAIAYTFEEARTDERGVRLTLRRVESVVDQILDQRERTADVENDDIAR